MKNIILALGTLLIVSLAACKHNKVSTISPMTHDSMTVEGVDSTIYGVCGESTGMSVMQLITDNGDTLEIVVGDPEDKDVVKGGIFVGDKMAVTAYKTDEGWVATQIINMSSLIGKWTSIDKNFEIEEGGQVKSYIKAESNPWTSWKIYNGHLLLNKDTFDIEELGSDSIYIENSMGIYTFKRQK